jgi:hypothetical protein
MHTEITVLVNLVLKFNNSSPIAHLLTTTTTTKTLSTYKLVKLLKKKKIWSLAWWHTPVIPALRRLKQENYTA